MQVLLCGTHYGATYVEALHQHPAGLRLAGILARGGESSRALARQLSLPYYASVEALPPGAVDAAVVAIGSGGPALVMALLERGIHVLAEHPVAPEDLEQLLAAAARLGRVFHLNSHFADLETVAPFVHHCAEQCRHYRPLFVNAQLNPRTAFSLIEILGRALGPLEPFAFGQPAAPPTAEGAAPTAEGAAPTAEGAAPTAEGAAPAAFAAIPATLAGIAATFLCQRVVSAADDGSATLVGHQILAGFPAGSLFLGDAFGPVAWLTRLGGNIPPQLPWWAPLGPPSELAGDPGSGIRRRANQLALMRFARQIAGAPAPPMQTPRHLLGVARVWSALFAAMGPTELGQYP